MKKILITINVILVIIVVALGVNNQRNYLKYTQTKNLEDKAKAQLSDTKIKLQKLKKVKSENEKKSDADNINKNVNGFVNAYFNYSGNNRTKIYDNVKPYATEYLINKIKPASTSNAANTSTAASTNVNTNNSQNNVNYSVYIKNVRIYKMSQEDKYNTNVLVLADEGLQTSTSNATSSVLLELKLRNVNSNWLVDDILQNKPLQNTQK